VSLMAYCPKCGNLVDETMTFCPRCGASLKPETTTYQAAPAATASTVPTAPYRARNEKQEKQEKGEKQEKNQPEKGEKHEKGEFGVIGWVIGGIVLIFFGVLAYTNVVYRWVPSGPLAGAFWLLAIGIVIIAVGVYFALRARMRTPRPA
jgi:uncharacterized membrane protein YvbJ